MRSPRKDAKLAREAFLEQAAKRDEQLAQKLFQENTHTITRQHKSQNKQINSLVEKSEKLQTIPEKLIESSSSNLKTPEKSFENKGKLIINNKMDKKEDELQSKSETQKKEPKQKGFFDVFKKEAESEKNIEEATKEEPKGFFDNLFKKSEPETQKKEEPKSKGIFDIFKKTEESEIKVTEPEDKKESQAASKGIFDIFKKTEESEIKVTEPEDKKESQTASKGFFDIFKKPNPTNELKNDVPKDESPLQISKGIPDISKKSETSKSKDEPVKGFFDFLKIDGTKSEETLEKKKHTDSSIKNAEITNEIRQVDDHDESLGKTQEKPKLSDTREKNHNRIKIVAKTEETSSSYRQNNTVMMNTSIKDIESGTLDYQISMKKKPAYFEKSYNNIRTDLLQDLSNSNGYAPYPKSNAARNSPGYRTEEENLRAIWNELGVGRNGYLSKDELRRVCEHIGMDDMSDEDLATLFRKLDTKNEGSVSFDGFLTGLYRKSSLRRPNNRIGSSPDISRKTAALRAGLGGKIGFNSNFDRTQVQMPGSSVTSGLFSVLNLDGSGVARGTEVEKYWSRLGVTAPNDVLRTLGFDPFGRISLVDLSYSLDRELSMFNPNNQIILAAILSYQNEMRNVKSSLKTALTDNDRLVNDLQSALASSNKFESLGAVSDLQSQRLYVDKIQLLQAELNHERESLHTQMGRQKKSLENVILQLKEEDARLRDHVVNLEKELNKVEGDLLDTQERLVESEKLNIRQQRELDAVADLHRKMNSELKQLREYKLFAGQGMNKDERDQMNDLKQSLETEIEELRQTRDLNEAYRTKVDELRLTSDRITAHANRVRDDAHSAEEKEALAKKAENELLKIEKRHNELLQATNDRITKENRSMDEELSILNRKVTEIETELEFKTQELDNLREMNRKLTDSIERSEMNLEKEMQYCDLKKRETELLKKDIENIQLKIKDLENQLSEASTDRAVKQEEIKDLQMKLAETKREKESSDKLTQEARIKQDSLGKDLESLSEANNRLSAALDEHNKTANEKILEVETQSMELSRLKAEISEIQEIRTKLSTDKITFERDLQTKTAEIDKLNDELKQVYREKEELDRQIRNLEDSLQTKNTETETYKKNNDKLSLTIEQQSKNLDQKTSELELRKKEIESFKEDKKKLLDDLKNEEMKSHEKYMENYREILEVKRVRDDLLRQKSSNEAQIQRHVEKIEALTHEIKQLKENNEKMLESLGQAQNMTKDKEIELSEVQSSFEKIKEELSQIKSEKDSADSKITELEGNLGQITAEKDDLTAKNGQLEEDLLKKGSEFDEIKMESEKDLDDKKKQIERLTVSLERFTSSLEERTNELNGKSKEIIELRSEKDELIAERQRNSFALKRLQVELEKSIADNEEIKKQKLSIDGKKFEAESNLREVTNRLNEKIRQEANFKSNIERMELDLSESKASYSVQYKELTQFRIECDIALRERDRLKVQIEELQQNLEQNQAKILDAQGEIRSQKIEIEKLKQNISKLDHDLEMNTENINLKNSEISNFKDKIEKLENELREANKQLDERNITLDQLKSVNERLKNSNDDIIIKLDQIASSGDKENQIESIANELSLATKLRQRSERELIDCKMRLETALRHLEREKEKAFELDRKKRELEEAMLIIKDENVTVKKDLNNAKTELNKLKSDDHNTKSEMEQKLSRQNSELERLRKSVEDKSTELLRCKIEFSNALRDRDASYNLQQQMEKTMETQKISVAKLKTDLKNMLPRSDLDRVTKQLVEYERRCKELEKITEQVQDETTRQLKEQDKSLKLNLQDLQKQLNIQMERVARADSAFREVNTENMRLVRSLRSAQDRILSLENQLKANRKMRGYQGRTGDPV